MAAGALVAVAGIWMAWASGSAIGSGTKTVEIPLGAARSRIATLLREGGAIKSRTAFLLFSRVRRGALRAGEYEFGPRDGLSAVLAKLHGGKVLLHAVTVPEGFDSDQIALAIEAKGLCKADAFRAALRDAALLSSHRIEAATSEGYLFPDTYRVPKGITARQLAGMMLDQFDRRVGDTLRAAAKPAGLSFHQALTLASLIEKETGKSDERPLVSAVFHNRRAQKMRLESCASVYYALKLAGRKPAGDAADLPTGAGIPRHASRLKLADLDVDSPYNTYRHMDLPPGPICSPGLPAIQAALAPANVPYVFFVSRGDGGHDFAARYEDFLKDKRANKRKTRAAKIS